MLDCIHICVFPFLKNYFKANSTDPWHLSILGLSVELFSFFLLQSRHLSIARWIDWESFCPLDSFLTNPRSIELPFALDTCSIDASIEPFKARQILDTSQSIEIYWGLYKGRSHFLISFLSISLDLSSLLTPQKLSHSLLTSSSRILQAYSSFSSLGRFQIPHFHAFHASCISNSSSSCISCFIQVFWDFCKI